MKKITKRVLSFVLAMIMTAMCFAGVTAVVIADGETIPIPPGYYVVGDTLRLNFDTYEDIGTQGGFNFVLGEGTFGLTNVSYDSGVGHNALGSIKFDTGDTGMWKFWTKGTMLQNKEYIISCYVKGTVGTNFRIDHEEIITGEAKTLDSTGWTLYTTRMKPTAAYNRDNSYPFKIRVSDHTSPVYVDDIRITEITKDVSLIDKNGGFMKYEILAGVNGRDTHYATFNLGFKMDTDKTYTVDFDMMASKTGITLCYDAGLGGAQSTSVTTPGVWEHKQLTYTCTNNGGFNGSRLFMDSTDPEGTVVCFDNLVVKDPDGKTVYSNDFTVIPSNQGVVDEGTAKSEWIRSDLTKLAGNENGGFLKVTNESSGPDGVRGMSIALTNPRAATYVAEVKILTNNNAMWFALDDGTGGSSAIGEHWFNSSCVPNGEWRVVKKEFTMPENNIKTGLRLYSNAGGNAMALIDYIKIYEKDDPSCEVYSEYFDTLSAPAGMNSNDHTAHVPCVDVTITDLNKDRTFAALKYVINHNTVNKDNGAKINYGGNLQFPVTGATPGVTYVASYDVYYSSVAVTIGQRVYANGYINLGTGWGKPSKAGVWETISNEFTIGEGKNLTYLDFYINANNGKEATMLFDNIKIYEKDNPENVLCDYNLDFMQYSALSATIGFWHGVADIRTLPENASGGYVYMNLADPGTGGSVYAEISGQATFEPGKTYTVTYDMLANRTGILLGFDSWDGTHGKWNHEKTKWKGPSKAGVWETCTSEYTVPADCGGAKFRLYASTTTYGQVIVDNVKIVDKATGETIFERDYQSADVTVSSNAYYVPYDMSKLPEIANGEGGFIEFPKADSYKAFSFDCAMEQGKTYVVSVDAMFDVLNVGSVGFDFGTGADAVWKRPASLCTWETITFDFKANQNITNLRFYKVNTGVTMYLDNILIKEKETGTVVYKNDMSAATVGGLNYHPYDINKFDELKSRGYVSFAAINFTAPDANGNQFSYGDIVFTGIEPNTAYKATFKSYTGNGNISFGLDDYNGDTVWKGSKALKQWANVEITFTTHANASKLRLYINPNKTTGYVLLDDLKLEKVDGGEVVYESNFNAEKPNISGNATWYRYDCFGEHSLTGGYCDVQVCRNCGAKEPAPHYFSSQAELVSAGDRHFQVCVLCETAINEESIEKHVYDHAYDTDCNVCGATRTVGTCGDVDGNGEVNGLDLIALAKYSLEILTADDIRMKNADIDGNTLVNGLDLIAYAKRELGLSSSHDLPNRDSAVDPEPVPEEKPEEKFYPETEDKTTLAEHEKIANWFLGKVNDMSLIHAKIGNDDEATVRARLTKDVKTSTDAEGNTKVVATYDDATSKIRFTLTGTIYKNSPSIDYVVTAKNTGTVTSPAITDFYVINDSFDLNGTSFTLNTNKGSWQERYQNDDGSSEDFTPVQKTLTTSYTEFNSNHGTSSVENFPFYDIIGDNQGLIMAIGWSGDWSSGFKKGDNTVSIKAKQQNLNTVLLAGEEIRTPSFVMTYFEGDEEYGHNVWRKLILDHYTPDDGTENKFVSPISLNVWGETPASEMIKVIKAAVDNEIKADIFWVDSGWYDPIDHSEGSTDAWHKHLGAWTENAALFPNGINEAFEYAHENSEMKTMLWWMIEDARAAVKEKWILGEENYYSNGGSDYMLALDRDTTYNTVLSYFMDYIEEKDLDCIRLDKSTTLSGGWLLEDTRRAAEEAPGLSRRGITENKYIVNFYKLWDALIEEYPGFMLDNTCSGGRRIDIEMTKRSIPLWRTDSNSDLESQQAMTQYLAKWIPLSGIGVPNGTNKYNTRSYLSSSTSISLASNNKFDASKIAATKAIYDEFSSLRPYWYGSYYQILTPNGAKDNWQAYELYRDDWQKGILVVIRRDSETASQKIFFEGLDSDGIYSVTNIDEPADVIVRTGKELMESGLDIVLPNAKTINIYQITNLI